MTTAADPESFFIHSGMELTYADPAFRSLIGAESQTQLVGRHLTAIVTPEYQTQFCEQVARIENEDAAILGLTVELQITTNRTQRAIVLSSLIEWDGTQQVQTRVFLIGGSDSPAAHLLREQAMDEAPIGITISDPSQPDNPLIYVNDGFSNLTGYPRDEILGQNCRFLQGEATREEPVARMRNAIDEQEAVAVELRNYRRDGSMFWNRVTIVPIRSDSGTITNWLGYQQDITAEKRYEQDLSLFKEQADGSDRAIFITDPDGTIEYVNPGFERLTGYTAAEARGRNPSILKSDKQDDALYAELWETITAGEIWEAELTNRTKYGELFEIKQKIIPVTDDHGEIAYFVGIETEITEKLLKKQALDVLNRVLRHNLRNSLNVIGGHAERLEDETLDPDTRQASIETIRDRTATLQTLAEKTAEISAVWDPNEATHTWEQLDVAALFDTYQRQYADADITVRFEGEGDGYIQVRNTELFEKAMAEAVENAIKHNDHSTAEIVITVQRSPDTNQLRISVADNGRRIPEYEREVINAGAETQLKHSFGVGLWVMKWVATTLGGELTIADNEPEGSVVTFQLPTGSNDGTETEGTDYR